MMKRFAILAVITALAAACADSTGPEAGSQPEDVGDRDGSPATVESSYNVKLRYLGAPTARQQLAVARAVEQWESVIEGDLAAIPVDTEAGACFRNQPAVSEVVDDILIYIDFTYVDGEGSILGEAGPCLIRSDNGLPVLGFLRLDAADLRRMEAIGTMDDVVLHEIGHALGIGTLWNSRKLLTGLGTSDPLFTGESARSAYAALGGVSAGVPIENSGESGTREGHWREAVFANELMTGWIGAGANPMSSVTIASLRDLGYNADPGAADAFALGDNSGGTMALRSGGHTDLRGRERVHTPKFKVDRHGRRSASNFDGRRGNRR